MRRTKNADRATPVWLIAANTLVNFIRLIVDVIRLS